MNIKKTAVAWFILSAFFAGSCRYDKQQLLDNNTTCDTANMRYAINIEPIIKAHCYSCHAGDASGSFGIKLDSYSDLKSEAVAGELLRRLTTTDNAELMPKGGPRLSGCDINKINAWIQTGTPQ